MKKIIFVGFTNDYDQLDIDSLKDEFDVRHIKLPKIFFKFLKRIIFIRSIYEGLIYILLKLIICRYSHIDLLVFKDEADYLPYINKFKVKVIVILRNILSPYMAEFIKKNNITAFTFDKEDSIKYNLLHYSQYSSVYFLLKKKKLFLSQNFDLCFLGKDKGRKEFIEKLNHKLNSRYSTNFIIVDPVKKKRISLKDIFFKNKQFSYINYLTLQLSCSTVLDIVQNNQSSETMRFIEALSSGRKVITNVKYAVYHELYNDSNVLYFDDLDYLMSKIDQFMEKPFIQYPEHILIKYSSQYVLSEIITKYIKCQKD